MSSNRVTNKDLIEKLELVDGKVELIRSNNKKSKNSSLSMDDNSVSFILAEYQHLREKWKQTDARNESGIRLYLTSTTILVSASAIFFNQVKEFEYFIPVLVLVLSIYTVGSILILRRITSTKLRKLRYDKSMNLIRRFFIDKNAELKDYILMPSSTRAELNFENLLPESKRRVRSTVLIAFNLWISGLVSILATAAAYLVSNSIGAVEIGIGVLAWFIAVILLAVQNKQILVKMLKKILMED